MTWTAKADAYFAGLKAVKALISQGLLTGPAVPYVTNKLTIMVRKGNPKAIKALADLARPDLRLAMPNPQFEGVARQIKASLNKAGGETLAKAVYETKVADGSATLTRIHHRQTPLFLMQDAADAGVTATCGGGSRGGSASRSGARLARLHPLPGITGHLRAIRLQALRRDKTGRGLRQWVGNSALRATTMFAFATYNGRFRRHQSYASPKERPFSLVRPAVQAWNTGSGRKSPFSTGPVSSEPIHDDAIVA